ncbi:hypothetical protein Bhyg_07627, partial [Pseudolycoriella hygida]
MGQLRMVGSDQSRMLGKHDYGFRSSGQSYMQGSDHSQVRFQARRDDYRNTRFRNREMVQSDRYVDDFEDFEELDGKFPIRKKRYVEELEYSIRADLEFRFLLLSRMNELGGNKYEKCIREKMKYLFTNQVLECYTWRGTKEKDAFMQFKSLNNLILRSVRDLFPSTERHEYKEYMKLWLKHAKTRQRMVAYVYPERNSEEIDSDEDDDDNE